MSDKSKRVRRAQKTRNRVKRLEMTVLTVHKTSRHMYAQLIASGGKVLASVSTVNPTIRTDVAFSGNIKAAEVVGSKIAELANKLSIKQVAFDRSGFKYHGRVKALADAARNGGLEF